MRPRQRKALDPDDPIDALTEHIKKVKPVSGPKVEHPFASSSVRSATSTSTVGWYENAAQVKTLFKLSNLWMARRHLERVQG